MTHRSESEHDSLTQLRKAVLEACRTGELRQVKEGLATPNFFPPLNEGEVAKHHFSLAIPGSAHSQHLLHKMIEASCKSGQANVLRHITLALPIKPLGEGDLWVVLGAIRSGSPETLRVLCEADPHLVDLKFSHYGSPLEQAIIMYDQSKAAAMVETLLRAGASLADERKEHSTNGPVLFAVRHSVPDVFDVLMRFGGEQYLQDVLTLVEAAENDNRTMVRYLLDRGEDVNAVEATEAGRTALFAAAAEGHHQVVLYLLHRDANPSVAGTRGQLPAEIALVNGHSRVAEILDAWNESSRVTVDGQGNLQMR